MINAFLLAWLTHLTTKILADLHSSLFGPETVMEIFETTPSPVDLKNGKDEEPPEDTFILSTTNGHNENNKKAKKGKKKC